MKTLLEEDGKFFFTYLHQTSKTFVAFKGDQDFLRRCENLVLNYGISSSRKRVCRYGNEEIHRYNTSKDRLTASLLEYFKWEVISDANISNKIKYNCSINENEEINIDWDESLLSKEAREKLDLFWQTRVIEDNFIFKQFKSSGNYNPFPFNLTGASKAFFIRNPIRTEINLST
jgi:hypothetical protein